MTSGRRLVSEVWLPCIPDRRGTRVVTAALAIYA